MRLDCWFKPRTEAYSPLYTYVASRPLKSSLRGSRDLAMENENRVENRGEDGGEDRGPTRGKARM